MDRASVKQTALSPEFQQRQKFVKMAIVNHLRQNIPFSNDFIPSPVPGLASERSSLIPDDLAPKFMSMPGGMGSLHARTGHATSAQRSPSRADFPNTGTSTSLWTSRLHRLFNSAVGLYAFLSFSCCSIFFPFHSSFRSSGTAFKGSTTLQAKASEGVLETFGVLLEY